MTEPLVDLRGLHGHRVDFVLFGALAMVFYGFVQNTEDLDIVVAPNRENLDRVAEWLSSIEAVLKLNPKRRSGPRERWGMHKGIQRDELSGASFLEGDQAAGELEQCEVVLVFLGPADVLPSGG